MRASQGKQARDHAGLQFRMEHGAAQKVCSQYVLLFYRKLQENTTGKYAYRT
jgi:hypothetical protein